MAKNKSTVYLGYEDEPVTEKNNSLLNHMVNKVGGKPDWCNSEIAIPHCPICNLNRPLILQVYAPLENSQFHRTLYIFGCINPTCSSQSNSWICVRTQCLDKITEENVDKKVSSISMNVTWCKEADDWDDFEDNRNEENGNVLRNDNNKMSDDEDESNSMENDIIGGFDNFNIDDRNANCGAQGGAIGAYSTSNAFAELEGEESEIVTVETPISPERDLVAFLKQTPGIPKNLNKNLILNSFFIYVEEEKNDSSYQNQNLSDHIRELIQEYQQHDDICKKTSPESPTAIANDFEQESYEKSIPLHGDIMFHNFVSTIQKNPGQIVRYSRDTYPLLIAPLNEQIPKCQYCGSDCICEIQILPTIIPKLKFDNNEQIPLEFGNLLIFTCLKSCWDTPDKMRLEHVILQQEQ